MRLSDLKRREKAKITGLYLSPQSKTRLNGIGITEGAIIEYLRPAPLGDPKLFSVRGGIYALRKEVADKIIVLKREKKE